MHEYEELLQLHHNISLYTKNKKYLDNKIVTILMHNILKNTFRIIYSYLPESEMLVPMII